MLRTAAAQFIAAMHKSEVHNIAGKHQAHYAMQAHCHCCWTLVCRCFFVGKYKFPLVISGEYGWIRPWSAKRRGSDDAQTPRKWLGERPPRMHLHHESRNLQKSGVGIRCLPRSVSLISVNIKEIEPRGMDSYPALLKSRGLPGSIWAARGLISQSAFVIR